MLEQELQQYFGFDSFKKGQKEVIQRIVDRQSAAAIFPTGAGKSLCYQLPAMLLPEMTLVISPLLSLMKDQLDFLQEHDIPAARLDSTLSREDYNRILEDAKYGRLKILMISVERFKNERFRHHLERMRVGLLVVDEAHCISEWGHNFRPEYLKLPEYKQEFNIPNVLLLTATATEEVKEDMCRKFGIPPESVTVTGFYRENLFLHVSPAKESGKKTQLLQRINEDPGAPTIVYVTLQKTAEQVAGFLAVNQIGASPYHAGMRNEDREQIQNRFMGGTLNCVVATIAFGMGIDKKDIRRVIHYDLPKSIENYSQEIGRSGRDGQPSFCEILANRDNLNVLKNFIYGDTPEQASIQKLLEEIKETEGFMWEMKLTVLSKDLNIRSLPLKTLLVYLDMEGILRPKFAYFDEYSFRFNEGPNPIAHRFQGERRQFVETLFDFCDTKKVWTYLDVSGLLQHYGCERQRAITALEYFDEQGWIELHAKQAIEVYDIMTKAFDTQQTSEKMFRLFEEKERHEIKRIHEMLDFFESEACISTRLAAYFGEDLEQKICGHCSVCKEGKVTIEHTSELSPLADVDFQKVTQEFRTAIAEQWSVVNVTKFLCGIYTPAFSRLKVKSIPYFGSLERYPYQDIMQWARQY
ncbi:MAG: RecQ family ATP-dependent DNA helicase [bacterium]|nr:RecQ family ATP-dependent DNA helicase [bacterium]